MRYLKFLILGLSLLFFSCNETNKESSEHYVKTKLVVVYTDATLDTIDVYCEKVNGGLHCDGYYLSSRHCLVEKRGSTICCGVRKFYYIDNYTVKECPM